jgi:1,4-dihydroxy-2-naphthoate octaprenyltransferase
MKDTSIRVNSPKAWVLAARPKTLAGAAVPVLIGGAMAFHAMDGQIAWLPLVLCFLFALMMQIDANFVNDYFDFKRGNDDAATRLGPLRACSMGWVTPKAMRFALILSTALSCCVGLPLVLYGGWPMIIVGAFCVIFCYLYTLCLSYWGLGDLLVMVFFGLVPVCLTYYLCLPEGFQTVTLPVILSSLGCGFAIDALLIVNNYRDMENDRRDGKITLVVRAGHRGGQLLYLLTGVTAALLAVIVVAWQSNYWELAFLVIYPLLHVSTYRHLVAIDKGRELNKTLGETARNILVYGLTLSLAVLL